MIDETLSAEALRRRLENQQQVELALRAEVNGLSRSLRRARVLGVVVALLILVVPAVFLSGAVRLERVATRRFDLVDEKGRVRMGMAAAGVSAKLAQITLGAGGINLRSAEGGPRLNLLVDDALVSLDLYGRADARGARYDSSRKLDPLRFVSQDGRRFDVAASGASLQLAGAEKERTRLTTEFLRLEHEGFALLRGAHVFDLLIGAPTLATRDPVAGVHLDADGLRLDHLASPHRFITFTSRQLNVAGESMSELGLDELTIDERGQTARAKYQLPASSVPIRW